MIHNGHHTASLLTSDALSLTDTSPLRTNSQMHSLSMQDELGETLVVAEWLDVLLFKPNFLKLIHVSGAPPSPRPKSVHAYMDAVRCLSQHIVQ